MRYADSRIVRIDASVTFATCNNDFSGDENDTERERDCHFSHIERATFSVAGERDGGSLADQSQHVIKWLAKQPSLQHV